MTNFEPARINALHAGSLLLTPDASDARPATDIVLQCLKAIGLIDAALPVGDNRYCSGEHLFDLLAFTGCAVQFPSATNAANGLMVRLEGPFNAPQLRVGRNSRPPRCPNCRRSLADWRAQICDSTTVQAEESGRLHCDGCGAINPAWAWQWGHHAGSGSFFVIVEPVFPGEGQPLPRLLEALKRAHVGPWHHFYVQE
jgi:hypothetical protein